MVKNPPASAGDARDMGLIPESGRSPEEGNGNPLQCSCLENFKDRGAWQATVRGVPMSLSNRTEQQPNATCGLCLGRDSNEPTVKKNTGSISSSVMRHFPTRDPPV